MSDTRTENNERMTKIWEEMFKPKVSKELAMELASRLYGLDVIEIKPLNSFSDQNYHLKVSKQHQNPHIEEVSDDGYVLKIINTYKSSIENHFESIHAGMTRLFEKGLRVPQPVKNLEGKTWKLETVPLQERVLIEQKPDKDFKCGIHLLTYIPGVPVATFKNTEDNFFESGKLLAELHNALQDLDCPALKNKEIFSKANYFTFIETLLENQEDEEIKTMIRNVLDRYHSELEVPIKDVPHGFVHGDFNDHNILGRLKNSSSSEYTVDGILDFDDMHYGIYVFDLGILLGHITMVDKTIDDLEATGHAVAGYRSVRHLSEIELSLLKICMECRVSIMTFSSYAIKDDPDNAYIKSMSGLEPKRMALKRLANTTVDDLLVIWEDVLKKRNVEVK